MEPFDEILAYTDTVCEQIRWKKARPLIEKEIKDHIYDQRDAYIYDGENMETATKKALLQMGDAVTIGLELDKTHKPKPQWSMIVLTGLFMLIGLFANTILHLEYVILGTASHIAPLCIAFILFLLAYFFDFTWLSNYAFPSYCFLLLFSTLGVIFGTHINGTIYLYTGFFSLNLAYLSLVFPLGYALLIYALRSQGKKGLFLCGLGIIPPLILLFFISNLSGFLLFAFSALLLLGISVIKGWFGYNKKEEILLFLFTIFLVCIALICVSMIYGYRMEHSIFTDSHTSTNLSIIKEMLEHSSFIGKGNGSEAFEQEIGLLTLSVYDYLLVIFIYRFGFITLFMIGGFLFLFALIGFYQMTKQRSVLGSLVSCSILLSFVLQSAFYIIGNLTTFTSFPLSLPFMSYGKASLLMNAILIGFLLSVFRNGDIIQDKVQEQQPSRHHFSFITYSDGTLMIQLKR